MKKMMAGAAVAVSLMGLSAAVAPAAVAVGNDEGTTSVGGNGATDAFGNAVPRGDWSRQTQLAQGSLNNLCLGVPVKADAGSLAGVPVPVAAHGVDALSSPQDQQCIGNSTEGKGDEPLSQTPSNIPLLAGNGVANN
ncbi:rodlin [Streptomyces sp. NPDC001834]|uniref:rodlin n=1 Tax=Streptomyces sp. NPDC001834 TaxID=3364616 RepID=UPI0036BE9E61